MEENGKHCTCLHSTSSNRMVCCDACDTWYHIECVKIDPNIAQNTAVYFWHLCIKKSFSDILQYLRYNINCFLNNNSEDPVVALLNNFALVSKDEIRCFTLLKYPINNFEKITPNDSHLSIEPQTCWWITNQYNNSYMSVYCILYCYYYSVCKTFFLQKIQYLLSY